MFLHVEDENVFIYHVIECLVKEKYHRQVNQGWRETETAIPRAFCMIRFFPLLKTEK